MHTTMSSDSSGLKRKHESDASVSYSESDSDYEELEFFPYNVNRKYTAYEHTPPMPFGGDYDNPTPKDYRGVERKTQTKEQHCINRPGLHPKPGGKSIELRITSSDLSSSDYGPCVVGVNDTMVAKIFDPLYYKWIEYGVKQPVVYYADAAYSREAAAYLHLQKASETVKQHIPKFYGCFIVMVPTNEDKDGNQTGLRQVPLVLIDKLGGKCLKNVRPHTLRRSQRNTILEKIFKAEARIFSAGVKHEDIAPRNIFFDTQDWEDEKADIKFVDFDNSLVFAEDGVGDGWLAELLKAYPDRLVSPIPHLSSFEAVGELAAAGWLPMDEDKTNEWMMRHLRGDEYTPVKPDEDGFPSYELPDGKLM
jgi:hypothetical protein